MSTPIRNHFNFTKSQRSGIFTLLAVIFLIQLYYYFSDFKTITKTSAEEQQWLALQSKIDSLKKERVNDVPKIYPFNPNFISDFKGYKLGMSVEEIDRLLEFRKQNRYVNSASEFQQVTKISDSLLAVMSPYFKFPDWINQKNKKELKEYPKQKFDKSFNIIKGKEKIVMLDINSASQEDLMKIYGIGPAISERILKEKEKFGAFVSMEQMQFIWGLSPEVIAKLHEFFNIGALPQIEKIEINKASIKELANFPYFRYALAKEIVTFRSMNGRILGVEDLAKINSFPVEKINIIALYLEF